MQKTIYIQVYALSLLARSTGGITPKRQDRGTRPLVLPAEGVGDELTYMVLLTDSEQLVPRSNVRLATNPLYPNLRERPYTKTPTPTPTPFKVETVDEDEDDEEGNSPRMTAPSGETAQGSPIYNVFAQ